MTRAAAPSFSGSTRQCVVNGRRRFEHVVREFASRTLYQNQQKSTQRQRNKVKLTGNKRGGDWSYKHDRSRARSKPSGRVACCLRGYKVVQGKNIGIRTTL